MELPKKKHFIHIPKTGGTSIINDKRLSIVHSDIDDIKKSTINGINDFLNPHRDKPYDLKKYKQKPNGWMKNEKIFAHARYRDLVHTDRQYFSVIRNPWDRVISRWLYSLETVLKYRMGYKIGSLEYFLTEKSNYRYPSEEYTWFTTTENWFSQSEYLIDDSGIIVTDNLRFEHLSEDLKKYLKAEFKPLHLRKSSYKSKDYKEYYNNKTIQLVADIFKDDIENFGYDFDTSAKRNYWNV